MNCAQIQNGTEIALPVHDASVTDALLPVHVKTTGDLLEILEKNPPRFFRMLKTACGHLGRYLDLPGDQIPFDLIEARKRGFRPFLEGRRYSDNTIKTYIYQQRRLLKTAIQHGWNPKGNPASAWLPLFEEAAKERITDVVRHFANCTKTPKEVTKEAVDSWGKERIKDGLLFTTVATKKNDFWRLLQRRGWLESKPVHMLKFTPYSIPLAEMPLKLRTDIQSVLKWKQADFARNRPKFGKIRAVTANNTRLIFQQLTSYAIKIVGDDPQSLCDLIQPDYVEGFVEWMMNERHVKGDSIVGRLASVLAIVKYHPMFAGVDFAWFKTLLDSIPLEDPSERKKRKAEKYVFYEELEAIPEKLRANREALQRKRIKDPVKEALSFMEELMFRWYLVFPWRQRNMRKCMISGSTPNLFKAPIPAITEIDKPDWILAEEARNPDAEFWQISFTPNGTKTHVPVDLFVPRALVPYLEEYLTVYRPILVKDNDPDTLFTTERGKPLRSDRVGKIIGHWTTLFASKRTTPHMIRDSVAFKWLKVHPKDFLTLSKILWHKNVKTTIQIYGARFNESSGICAMEAWLEERSSAVH